MHSLYICAPQIRNRLSEIRNQFGGVAQLVERPDEHRESRRVRFCEKENGGVAQLVEQRTENPCVASSILAPTTIDFRALAQEVFYF